VKTIAKIERILKDVDTAGDWQVIQQQVNYYRQQWNIKQQKEKSRQEYLAMKAEWKLGDRVKFTHGETLCLGIITKVKTKRVVVDVYTGKPNISFDVPFQYLKRITTKNELMLLTIGKMGGTEMMATIINM